jgi:hypothetical protein
MNSFIKAASALGLAGALALSSAAPSFARDWNHRGAARAAGVGVGVAAGVVAGAAAASAYGSDYYGSGSYASGPYAYDSGVYAYGAGPGSDVYAYDGGAYGYDAAPRYSRSLASERGPVGYDTGGAAIYRSELGPNCTYGMKYQNRC